MWIALVLAAFAVIACNAQSGRSDRPPDQAVGQTTPPATSQSEGRPPTPALEPPTVASDRKVESPAVNRTVDETTNPARASGAPAESGRSPGFGGDVPSPPDGGVDTPDPGSGVEGTDRCRGISDRGRELTDLLAAEMDGFGGDWGFALIDLECGTEIAVNTDHSQYPASAGKIVIVIAALRAIADGSFEPDPALIEDVEEILVSSLGPPADRLAMQLSPEQISAVQSRAGVSDRSRLTETWRNAYFTAVDLARIWASLLLGDQLEPEHTDLVLELAGRALLPDEEGFWPFPADFGVAGVQYGQKAGFWESDEPTGYRVSAGYVRAHDRPGQGFAFAFLAQITAEGLEEDWRRAVFPIVRDFVNFELRDRK